ncbi:MAG: hypothetical protein H6633_03210 [Anaerolineales bacterium]|nr:hypothetical protein [Anaerolineales bacterium]
MSGFDGVLIFGLRLILIPAHRAIAGVYLIGRRNKREFQSLIEMDGAKCIQARDGRVTIKSKTMGQSYCQGFDGSLSRVRLADGR